MRSKEIIIPEAQSMAYFFKRQGRHFLLLSLLSCTSYAFAAPALNEGSWLGITDRTWYWSAIGLTVLHQVVVWIIWRVQLGWGSMTRIFGKIDLTLWGLIFMPLLIARPILLIGLSLSDMGSMAIPRFLGILIGFLLLPPSLYTLYSVGRYFGLNRALGGDHFRLKYRQMPMVNQGAFRWSGNAMYVFAFLGLWSIAFLSGSLAALSLAFFQHTYIWVHYHCTERPDMQLIYRTDPNLSKE